jgi:hypothetical protein
MAVFFLKIMLAVHIYMQTLINKHVTNILVVMGLSVTLLFSEVVPKHNRNVATFLIRIIMPQRHSNFLMPC